MNPLFASILLKFSQLNPHKNIKIGGSKSLSNRLLILKKLLENINIKNLSTSEDTVLLQKALQENSETVDVHHAGTALRFLTAYFSILENQTHTITGSERLKQRPIKDLVDALRSLGAEIHYLDKTGYPPIKIIGKKITGGLVKIKGNTSSQFITALLLVGAVLDKGLTVELLDEITSKPYLEMTISLLKQLGIEVEERENLIEIKKVNSLVSTDFTVESDWSSASYFYSMAAVGKKEIILESFFNPSLQGDSKLVEIYSQFFGVETEFNLIYNTLVLKPIVNFSYPKKLELNLNDTPDIAQTLCVTATILKIPFHFTGLQTLKIKETDRLVALQNELKKIGCICEISNDSILSKSFTTAENPVVIDTYNDHRMAMCFAPYCLVDSLVINQPDVVDKSYPYFWNDLALITQSL